MLERLRPRQRSLSTVLIALFTALQSISFTVFTVLIGVQASISIQQAVAKHKATAASLSTGFAVIGGGFFLAAAIFAFLLVWGQWRQQSWALWSTIVFEGLTFLFCLLFPLMGSNWLFLMEGAIAAVILTCQVVDLSTRRRSQT